MTEPPSGGQRLLSALRSAREKLCIAQTDMAWPSHREELQVALDLVDRLGVWYFPADWSKYAEPPLFDEGER